MLLKQIVNDFWNSDNRVRWNLRHRVIFGRCFNLDA
jgi:hypothetical protein